MARHVDGCAISLDRLLRGHMTVLHLTVTRYGATCPIQGPVLPQA